MSSQIELETQDKDLEWDAEVLPAGPTLPDISFDQFISQVDETKLTATEITHLHNLPLHYEKLQQWASYPIITDRFGTDHASRRELRQRLFAAAGTDTPEGKAYEHYMANLDNNKLRRNNLNYLNLVIYLLADGLSAALTGNSALRNDLTPLLEKMDQINDQTRTIAKTDYGSIDEHVTAIRQLEEEVACVGQDLSAAINRT